MKVVVCKDDNGADIEISGENISFRPSVYGLIVKDGEVLVLENITNKLLWLPGGGVEINEGIEEALKREFLEETDIQIQIGKFLFFHENFYYSHKNKEAYHALLFFYECLPFQTNLNDEKSEHDDWGKYLPVWKNIKELKGSDFIDAGDIICDAIRRLKPE